MTIAALTTLLSVAALVLAAAMDWDELLIAAGALGCFALGLGIGTWIS